MADSDVSPERWLARELWTIARDLASPRSDALSAGKRFLEVAAQSVGMNVASLVGVVGDTYLGPILSSCERRRGLSFTAGEGPIIDAARSGVVVEVRDMVAAKTRWPIYAPTAIAVGLRSAVCIPLQDRHGLKLLLVISGQTPIGKPLPDEELHCLARFAHDVLCGNPSVITPDSLQRLVDGAVGRNAVVYQACGALGAKLSVDPSVALDLLRLRAWADDKGLHEVAQEALSGREI